MDQGSSVAEGGLWRSETHGVVDSEHGYQQNDVQSPGMKKPASGVIYNPPPAPTVTGPFGVFAVLLRLAQVVFSLIGFAVMAANKETIYDTYYDIYYDLYITSSSTLKFTAVKAYVGLLSLDVIVCFYAIVQLVICIVQKGNVGSFISSPTAGSSLLTFIFDTVLAYTLGAACGAAAAAAAASSGSAFSEKFSDKADAAVAISFIAFAFLALSAALYPIRLLRALQSTKRV